MANTPARFAVVDIERILRAAKKADVSVHLEIEGSKISVDYTPGENQKPVEIDEPIVL
tara:strand:- start:2113 stop:2286 length:174 start_codon:yes stop_codon:yes gene_type:complete